MKNKTLILFLILTILTVFIFFQHTLNFTIKAHDDLAPFLETHVPTCFSLSEIFELISNLGLHQHFESTNLMYPNIVSLRCDPFCAFLHLMTQFIFQKNLFYYHLYGLLLHLINTALVFFIINKVSFITSATLSEKIRLLTVSLLTVLWATHPVNIESVLLLTNANITLSYTFSFLTFYLCLNSNFTLLKSWVLFFIFGLALFIAEFHFMIPVIILIYLLSTNKNAQLKKIFLNLAPLFIITLIFIVLFLFSKTKMSFETHSSFQLITERIFWLSPQILFHFFKLLFFPAQLSVDQTLLVKIGGSLLDPYAIFCIVFIFLILIFSMISLYKSKNKIPFFFITFFLLLLSLIPYSQIPAPVYNLASERYLYFPSFILIFGFSHLVFDVLSRKDLWQIPAILILSIILCVSGTRAYIRTFDWKDNISFFKSAIKATHNPLYKAFRYKRLIPQEKIFFKNAESEVEIKYKKTAYKLLEKSVISLRKEKEKYQKTIPLIVKNYGLDPETLLTKAGLLLASIEQDINKDHKKSLKIIEPFIQDLSLLHPPGLSFYSSLLFYNNRIDKAEEVLRYGYKRFPHSTSIAFQLCDLIQIKNGDLNEIEEIALREFKYFPYDSFVLFALIKVYELKGDLEKYAWFSYIYGLRQHSLQDLSNAYQVYIKLNQKDKAEKLKQAGLNTLQNLKKKKYIL